MLSFHLMEGVMLIGGMSMIVERRAASWSFCTVSKSDETATSMDAFESVEVSSSSLSPKTSEYFGIADVSI